ncbi:MAG: sigma-70 family RNA polymerase sigma factor [Planctomycetota bacterium]
MHDPAHDDLYEHARSLRGLARALVGAADADDLVQETAVRALDHGHVETRSVGGWLATIMRNLASTRRTADARRRRRERASGAGRPDEAPSALTAAARLEAIDRLHASLRSLADPYREVLLLRYFEGQTPQQIATQRGEPLATVKSRLRRGLEQLRRSLDERAPREHWRGAFVAAFGLGSVAPATAAAGLLTLTWMMMMSWKFLCGAAAAIAFSVWLWHDGRAPAPQGAVTGVPGSAQVATAEPDPDRDLVRESVPVAAKPTEVEAVPAVTFSGRAVDEQQRPLEGVQARLRTRHWDGGKVAEQAEVRTGPDGRFELAASPREGHRFEVTLQVDGRLPVEGDWHEVEGERIDLGDQLLPVPCIVHGRIVDAQGVAQPGAEVTLQPYNRNQLRKLEPHSRIYSHRIRADEAGAFTIDGGEALAPGRFGLDNGTRAVVRPRGSWQIEPGQQVCTLEVVVAPLSPVCRGIVVDPVGAPVAGATVSLGGANARTSADGRFEVRGLAEQTDGRYVVVADLDGWRRAQADWDGDPASPVRLTMVREPGLTLRVVDQRGAPIERFAVWLCPEVGWPFGPRIDTARHENGVVTLRLRQQDRLVCVEVPGEPVRWSSVLPVAAVEGADVEQVVRVVPAARRRVLLQVGGRPLAGARCDLADRGGLTVTPGGERWPMRARRASGREDARLVQRGVSDEQGALWLEGPPGPLALVVAGDGVPDQARPIDLRGDGDLVVDVSPGGLVRGRLVPIDVVQRLRAMIDARAARRGSRDLGLRLTRGSIEHPPVTRPPLRFDERGAFEFALEPGTWQLHFDGFADRVLAELVVDEGATIERAFDVSAMDPATIELQVHVDGALAPHAFVNAMGTHDRDAVGRLVTSQSMGTADDQGRFELTTLPGDLLLVISTQPAAGAGQQLQTVVRIAGPGRRTVDLQLQTASLELQLRGPGGEALADRDVLFGRAAWQTFGRTDADGRLRLDPFVAGTWPIFVWPSQLAERGARLEYQRRHGQPALHAQRIRLEDVVVAPGEHASAVRVVAER